MLTSRPEYLCRVGVCEKDVVDVNLKLATKSVKYISSRLVTITPSRRRDLMGHFECLGIL